MKDETVPDGYSIPTHHGITIDITMAGLPRGYAILVGTFSVASGMAMPSPIVGLILAVFIGSFGFGIGRWLTAQDARFFAKMRIRRPSHMRPW